MFYTGNLFYGAPGTLRLPRSRIQQSRRKFNHLVMAAYSQPLVQEQNAPITKCGRINIFCLGFTKANFLGAPAFT